LYMLPAFLAGMPPCYLDAAQRPESTLLPLPCDGVAYLGAPKRSWQARSGSALEFSR
jgi:citrate synthase